MNTRIKTALAMAAVLLASTAGAEVVFYEHEGFAGRSFSASRAVTNMARSGFNDTASSVVVLGDSWEACQNADYGGRCVVLPPGRYPSLNALGMSDAISSVRTISRDARYDADRYAEPAEPAYDNRRRRNERLFKANVTSARAVVGTPEQRCWIERETVQAPARSNSVPGAVIGAVLGGVLGHQVGGGSGRDLATVAGVIGGGVVGANVGGRSGNDGAPQTQDVQRCASEPGNARVDYWDVTYRFRGQDHRVQMTTNPGRSITVNRDGEPRVAG